MAKNKTKRLNGVPSLELETPGFYKVTLHDIHTLAATLTVRECESKGIAIDTETLEEDSTHKYQSRKIFDYYYAEIINCLNI